MPATDATLLSLDNRPLWRIVANNLHAERLAIEQCAEDSNPQVVELAEEWAGQVKVVKLDVDNNQNIAMQYQVMGVPTLALFEGGELKERMTGFRPKNQIIKKLSPHI